MGNRRDHSCRDTRGLGCLRMSVVLGQKNVRPEVQSPYRCLTLLLLLLSRVSRVPLCATPETAAHQAPRSLGFSRQEHWSGLPLPDPRAWLSLFHKCFLIRLLRAGIILACDKFSVNPSQVVLVPAIRAWRSSSSVAHISLWPVCRKHQQYDCKWYIPLADLVFPSPEESEASPQVHPFPDHELEDMKMKISALKSEIQKEVSRAWHQLGLRSWPFSLWTLELGVPGKWRKKW